MSMDRRQFVTGLIVTGAAATVPTTAADEAFAAQTADPSPHREEQGHWNSTIDFRYAPHRSQATICFPDDPHKSLIGQAGDMRYRFPHAQLVGVEDFGLVFELSLAGFQDDRVVRQWAESPSVPIIHTLIERPAATLELIAFATNRESDGRVDNVLMKIKSKSGRVAVMPRIHINTCFKLSPGGEYGSPIAVAIDEETKAPVLVGTKLGAALGYSQWWEEAAYTLYLSHGEATPTEEAQYFLRFPQEKQSLATIQQQLQNADALLAEARDFWKSWMPFGTTSWSYPDNHGEFLISCARNIQQAREVKDGQLVFEVGPTVYRGLWIVDGNFLLEAARYLGYDKEADNGLRSEWSKQVASGQVIAGGGDEHWKDTAIAMFTLVRQCELKQDWSFFRELEPNVTHAIDFLIGLRDDARKGNSTNGRYGLLAPGFADGGIAGVRSEFTNTVWALAGLRAVAHAAEKQKMPALAKAGEFYKELRAAFEEAAKKEMVHDPAGFDYLPMLAHDDPSWHDPDPWSRPRPQSAQWALSHAIYPGLVFDKNDPIVRGHIALMQSCTKEDVPTDTGWLRHDSVWTYNASFVAHVYLWAGLRDWAHRTLTGFLNHASPLCCWREEQPLQRALVGEDLGDMPHNWASAECVRYLRHMLVLEDGASLRLLEGITAAELKHGTPYVLEKSPTRFGRVNLTFDPSARKQLVAKFHRDNGPRPESVRLPAEIAGLQANRILRASFKRTGTHIEVDPAATSWEARWS